MPKLTNPPTVYLPCTIRDDGSLEVEVPTNTGLASLTHPLAELEIDIDEDHDGTALQIPHIEQGNVRYVVSATTIIEQGTALHPAKEAWAPSGSGIAIGKIHGDPDGRVGRVEISAVAGGYIDPSGGEPELDTTEKKGTIRIRIHEKGIRPVL